MVRHELVEDVELIWKTIRWLETDDLIDLKKTIEEELEKRDSRADLKRKKG